MKHRIPSALALALLLACGPAETEPPAPSRDRLEAVDPLPLRLPPGGEGPVRVRVLGPEGPRPDREVAFRLEGAAEAARLTAFGARSDAAGEASVRLLAGRGPARFSIVADVEGAAALHLPVEVPGDDAPSALVVEVAWPEGLRRPLQRIVVALHSGRAPCAVLGPDGPTALESRELVPPEGVARFEALDPTTPVTIHAQGWNDRAMVAQACAEAVGLPPGLEREVRLELAARPVQPQGGYGLVARFDFSEALPGEAGRALGTLVRLFDDPDDPARYLVETLEATAGFDLGFARGAFVAAVDRLLSQLLPDAFFELADALGHVARAVSDLTLEGTLVLSPQSDGRLLAHETWQRAVFTWAGAGCDPDREPGCERHPVSLRDTPVREVESVYDAWVDEGRLELGHHTRRVPYARFFHVFLVGVLFQEAAPGVDGAAGLLLALIDCDRLASGLDDADGRRDGTFGVGPVSLSTGGFARGCRDALLVSGLAMDAALDTVAAAAPSDVTLDGAVLLQDADHDLVPERLSEGRWEGWLQSADGAWPVQAAFEAARVTD